MSSLLPSSWALFVLIRRAILSSSSSCSSPPLPPCCAHPASFRSSPLALKFTRCCLVKGNLRWWGAKRFLYAVCILWLPLVIFCHILFVFYCIASLLALASQGARNGEAGRQEAFQCIWRSTLQPFLAKSPGLLGREADTWKTWRKCYGRQFNSIYFNNLQFDSCLLGQSGGTKFSFAFNARFQGVRSPRKFMRYKRKFMRYKPRQQSLECIGPIWLGPVWSGGHTVIAANTARSQSSSEHCSVERSKAVVITCL